MAMPAKPLTAGSGAFAFCCRQNPAYCMYKNKKKKGKNTYET